MKIGLIGCGNMARAMARGWGEPVLCADPVADRARALAQETGGEACGSNAEVAERSDLVVLCHKPAQLEDVAGEIGTAVRAVASILAATPLAKLKQVYPGKPVFRFLPSLPVEVRRGAIVQAADPERARAGERPGNSGERPNGPGEPSGADGVDGVDGEVHDLFARLGTLVVIDDALVDVAMGLMSCAPAYVALVAEAQIDAGVRRGLPPAQAAALVTETLGGTAELLRKRNYDTLAVRREVSSPGGITARGLDALERGGIRAAFSDALDAVLGR
jgi:pyrroline-5-carboxylate reductase